MTDQPLSAADFAGYFTDLWGDAPFPWQQALASRLLDPTRGDDDWPAAITPPTAAGKTACIDIALFALAAQADRGAARPSGSPVGSPAGAPVGSPAGSPGGSQKAPLTAPRRIFFVVDRRVIVDEAFERSRALAGKLAGAEAGVLARVAGALRRLARGDLAGGAVGEDGDDQPPPVTCFQLRGGIYRDDGWARSPIQPTIVCATVDQVGSRLLYRAYGRSFKAWPLQAGLVGNDSLILLDEAHCAEPFRQTVQAVARYRTWAAAPPASPLRVVVMTATPPPDLPRFPDADTAAADRAHPVLRGRIEAAKPCRLAVADKAKGRDAGKVNQALADELVKHALDLIAGWAGPADAGAGAPASAGALGTPASAGALGVAASAGALGVAASAAPADEFRLEPPGEPAPPPAPAGSPALVIFCNRVDTARRAYHKLLHRNDLDALLLTGRMRPLDRDDALAGRLRDLAAGAAAGRRLPRALVVVATQTLEVGANLDFDLLVSECADLAALRQRCGRLNRMGRPIDARGVIVVGADQTGDDAPADPVYGPALPATWAWLNEQAEAGVIDFGIAAFERYDRAALGRLLATRPAAPVLLPAHLDALVQTAPRPTPEPDIALFLHGPQAGPADVHLCWRADLPFDPARTDDSDDDQDAWIDLVAACPPAAGELMPVPFVAFRRWLAAAGDPKASDADADHAADGGDVEGTDSEPEAPERQRATPKRCPPVLRWCGPEDSALATRPEDIRPGDLLVLPVAVGGWGALGHRPPDSPADLGDRANLLARGRPVLRLTPASIADWPGAPLAGDEATAAPPDPSAAARLLAVLASGDAAGGDTLSARLDDDPAAVVGALREALTALAQEADRPDWLRTLARALAADGGLRRGLALHGDRGLVLRGAKLPRPDDAGSDFTHEDDATASGSVGRPVVLTKHLDGVRQFAARFTADVPPAQADDVQLAAALHDLGKADPRFQAWLRGGSRWLIGDLLAKSGQVPKSRVASQQAMKDARYPPGARHELLSIRLIEHAPALLAEAHDPDLVLHLVGSHHGWCRPFAPVVFDPDPQDVRLGHAGHRLGANTATGLERLDSGVAERFWRLVRRYGWWGLAGLEAAMILADHRRSEWEERHGDDDA